MKDEQQLPEVQQKKAGVSRRNFLKTVTGTVAGIGISQVINPALIQALEKGLKRHPVLWIQGQGCTGCSVTLLNSTSPPIADILLKVISLQFNPTVQASEGEMAMEQLKGIIEYATKALEMMKPETQLEAWVQSKLTSATDYIETVHSYMQSRLDNKDENPK